MCASFTIYQGRYHRIAPYGRERLSVEINGQVWNTRGRIVQSRVDAMFLHTYVGTHNNTKAIPPKLFSVVRIVGLPQTRSASSMAS